MEQLGSQNADLQKQMARLLQQLDLPLVPDIPLKQTSVEIGDPVIFNHTDDPSKKLTIKDIYPDPKKKKKKLKRKKGKKKKKKKALNIVRPSWPK